MCSNPDILLDHYVRAFQRLRIHGAARFRAMITVNKRAAAGDPAVVGDRDAGANIELGVSANKHAVSNLDRRAWLPETVVFEIYTGLDDALLAD